MKLKMSLAFIFLFIGSLLLTMPASLITYIIPQNAGVNIANISGTVWNGKVSQLEVRDQFQLQKLSWKLDWLALLSLKIKADINFHNGLRVMSGEGSVVYGFSGLALTDFNADVKASTLVPYLSLPVPITPTGKLSLIIEKGSLGSPYCGEIEGALFWNDATIATPMGKIDLDAPSVDLSCTEGGVLAVLKQHSEQLTTNATITLKEGGQYQLEGDIIGSDKLDPSILQALSWIGPKKETGETLLNFKGRL